MLLEIDGLNLSLATKRHYRAFEDETLPQKPTTGCQDCWKTCFLASEGT